MSRRSSCECRNRQPRRGILCEARQPPRSGLFSLRTDHTPRSRPPIPRRLRLKKRPCPRVGPEQCLLRRLKTNTGLFKSVNAGTLFFSRSEHPQHRQVPSAQTDRFPCPPRIHQAPDTARPAGREANTVTDIVDSATHPVDPAETQRRVHRFRPDNTCQSRIPLQEPDHHFRLSRDAVRAMPATPPELQKFHQFHQFDPGRLLPRSLLRQGEQIGNNVLHVLLRKFIGRHGRAW